MYKLSEKRMKAVKMLFVFVAVNDWHLMALSVLSIELIFDFG